MASRYHLEGTAKQKPIRFIFYGVEGIGKSTLASKLPGVVFIDTEGSTDYMTVCRYPRPQSWDILMDMVDDAGQQHVGTLVIDTADWAERLCVDALCSARGWKGIEDAGYGKGYVYLKEKFGQLLDKLTSLQDKGINVGFTAHAQLRKVEHPEETGAYDHWELKVSKQVGPMLKEWADLLLFCNYKTMVIHGKTPMDKNKIAGGKRVMYTTHNPVWDAKNRFNLPEELPLDYEGIRAVFERHTPAQAAPAAVSDFEHAEPTTNEPPQDELPDVPFTGPETGPALTKPKPEAEWTEEEKASVQPVSLADKFPDLAQLMEASGVQYSEVQAAVSSRGYFPGDMPIEMYPADFVKGCLVAAWDSVKKLIFDMRRK